MSDLYWTTVYVVPGTRSTHRACGLVKHLLKRAGLDPDDATLGYWNGTVSDPSCTVVVFGEQATHDAVAVKYAALPRPVAMAPIFGVAKSGRLACHQHPTVCCLIEPRDGMYLGDHSETCRTTMLSRPIPKLSTDRVNHMVDNLRITL